MAILKFDDEEQKKVAEFWKKDCKLKNNSGAIGGRMTYTIKPTSLGNIIKVVCDCGEELDLTDYDDW